MTRDHLADNVLARYLKQSLPKDELRRSREHVAGCHECQERLRRLLADSSEVRSYAFGLSAYQLAQIDWPKEDEPQGVSQEPDFEPVVKKEDALALAVFGDAPEGGAGPHGFPKQNVEFALRKAQGKLKTAAASLGCSVGDLQRLIAQHGLVDLCQRLRADGH